MPSRHGRRPVAAEPHDDCRIAADRNSVRRHAIAVAAEIAAVGYTTTEIADLLHVTARTLRQWRHDEIQAAETIRLIGRPAHRSSREHRNSVIHYLDLFGPGIGLPPLRAAFPTMTRSELDDLLMRYRRVWHADTSSRCTS